MESFVIRYLPLAINLLLDDPCFLLTAYCLLLHAIAICHLLYALAAFGSPFPPHSANLKDMILHSLHTSIDSFVRFQDPAPFILIFSFSTGGLFLEIFPEFLLGLLP
jgi:hypothetical protein